MNIAVIDTETTYYDHVCSIGVVIADDTYFNIAEKIYFVIEPTCEEPSMFSYVLNIVRDKETFAKRCSREEAMKILKTKLTKHGVTKIFAYNAKFDYGHLVELKSYEWYDIMRIAAYKDLNKSIPSYLPSYKTGRLKTGYGVENMIRILSGDCSYCEVHNAVCDAEDELMIMRLLELPILSYEIGKIS